MKLFIPEAENKDVLISLLDNGRFQLYIDVTCEDCGKVHALSNTHNGRCIRCGGICN